MGKYVLKWCAYVLFQRHIYKLNVINCNCLLIFAVWCGWYSLCESYDACQVLQCHCHSNSPTCLLLIGVGSFTYRILNIKHKIVLCLPGCTWTCCPIPMLWCLTMSLGIWFCLTVHFLLPVTVLRVYQWKIFYEMQQYCWNDTVSLHKTSIS